MKKRYGKIIEILRHRNLIFRVFLFSLALLPLFYFRDFYQHFYIYFTGNILTDIITQEWHIVILSISAFMLFLIPLSFRRKVNWTEYGLVSVFFISLFVEMYGIPLTILFASKYFFTGNANLPNNIIEFNFLGVDFGMDLAMVYGTILITLGITLIIAGWITLYKNAKKKSLVTCGIYSYSRHPQYFGFILIVIGWFFGWPTIVTLVFTPIMIYKYIEVCKKEEKEFLTKFNEYLNYKKTVPLFI